MTLCPHGHGELDASGNCPKQNLHVKARVGVACPLCGGPAHKRETDATTQQLQCAWRQFTRSQGHTGMLALDHMTADGFRMWLASAPRQYGREAQYQALAASGTPLSPAMAKDAARYTPGAAPTTVAPVVAEAQHTPVQCEPEASQETVPVSLATVPEGETPDERRARVRQALAS